MLRYLKQFNFQSRSKIVTDWRQDLLRSKGIDNFKTSNILASGSPDEGKLHLAEHHHHQLQADMKQQTRFTAFF